VVEHQVDERLGAEVLDESDTRGDRPLVPDRHGLRAEADRRALAAVEHLADPDLGAGEVDESIDGHRDHVHRRGTDEAGDEDVGG
jgi:hypothetical protein